VGINQIQKIIISAEIIRLIHISIILYVLFGWIFTHKIIWYSILIIVPLLEIHWKTNNDQCFLTTIEKKLRKSENDNSTFVGNLSKKYIKIEPSERILSLIIRLGMYSSAILCLAKITISK
tara:strand:- start:40950 stop:41312 length:363 start_codon:yes stop_codon:yes gene_type:complete